MAARSTSSAATMAIVRRRPLKWRANWSSKTKYYCCSIRSGTPPNLAIRGYLNDNKVPQLFVGSGDPAMNDPKHYPWTIGFAPSYRFEGRVYGRYMLKNLPDAKIAVLYQNDDLGKGYLNGLREGLGQKADKMIVATQSYETTDALVNSQVLLLHGSGADTMLTAGIPKFAAQAIRKIYVLGWKPTHFLSNISASVGMVMQPLGPEKTVGMITAGYLKEPTDPQWHDTPEYREWLAWIKNTIRQVMSPTALTYTLTQWRRPSLQCSRRAVTILPAKT